MCPQHGTEDGGPSPSELVLAAIPVCCVFTRAGKNTPGKRKMAGYSVLAGSIALLALVETEPKGRLCVHGALHPVGFVCYLTKVTN